MTMQPGNYHAEGDPQGTVRYWDGTEWLGGPFVGQDSALGNPHEAISNAASGYATWGSRFAARFIDGLVSLVLVIAALVLGLLLGVFNETLGLVVGGLLFLVAIVATIYLTVWLQGTTGQSPGKRVMGIETLKESGGYIGGGSSFGRWLLDVLNQLPLYLGYLWPLWDDKSQTFTDKIFGAVVKETNRPKSLLPLIPKR